jgi:hypothetical protein
MGIQGLVAEPVCPPDTGMITRHRIEPDPFKTGAERTHLCSKVLQMCFPDGVPAC